jgi:methionyl-tRNA formyltransferase
MKIDVVCSDPNHPVMPYLNKWRQAPGNQVHEIQIVHDVNVVTGGDIMFLVSCSQIVDEVIKKQYRHCLVIHASDLPRGRGWSPYIWNILKGDSELTVCVLEASLPVDSGDVWLREHFSLQGHELLPEIHALLFAAEISLMDKVIARLPDIRPVQQDSSKASTYPRRTSEDSRLDPDKSIAEQFDLLRVVDTERFPAFFEFRGQRYKLTINKDNE